MNDRKTYKAFGLRVVSDFELDVLEPLNDHFDKVDLHIRRVEGLIRNRNRPSDPWFEFTPQTQYMYWHAIGAYLIQDDANILVDPLPGSSDHLVSQALLGLVMSLVLERRKLLCLHAGAIEVDARAVVLLGDKGAGKSTTSAAMMSAGYRPITDDLVAVDVPLDRKLPPSIRPGFSSLKLWPDSVAALQLPSSDKDRLVHPKSDKVQKRMPGKMPEDDTVLGAAFVLRRSPHLREPIATKLAPHDALQNLLRYTFMARYGETQLGQDHLVLHMKRCAALAAMVSVYILEYPDDLTQLDAVVETICEHTSESSLLRQHDHLFV